MDPAKNESEFFFLPLTVNLSKPSLFQPTFSVLLTFMPVTVYFNVFSKLMHLHNDFLR